MLIFLPLVICAFIVSYPPGGNNWMIVLYLVLSCRFFILRGMQAKTSPLSRFQEKQGYFLQFPVFLDPQAVQGTAKVACAVRYS